MEKVTVKGLGKEFVVPLPDTLKELKRLVARQSGVPAFQQRLLLHPEGRLLQDRPDLDSQGLWPGGVVVLVVELCDSPLTILVKNHQSVSKAYDVLLTDTVAELQRQVSEKEKVHVDQFYLNFQGMPMEDREQLGEYELTPSCTVDMHLRMRGGAGALARRPHHGQ
ncbi:ubiquitin-like protein ISG15 [Suncus etruscus]|uniref:ubiquitin-like protein ISG15 n=1 Tax=Suncus etruscus TaxID=109475 RepID=UPI0021100987|nr:ubiquitin-like protein ISG15 [Suncus etruscus]